VSFSPLMIGRPNDCNPQTLPAIAVAMILGFTLVTEVSESEVDFNRANSVASEMLVLIEKEQGLIVRLPAELDLGRIDGYTREIPGIEQKFEANIKDLAMIEGIVSPAVVKEIRATRQQMKAISDTILDASRSFAQTTALELVNGHWKKRLRSSIRFSTRSRPTSTLLRRTLESN
jgi:hypothetical protein